MKETYKVSVEVFKYPYCGKSVESEKFLSEKICCSTIKVQKKIIKGIKWSIFYIELSVRLANGVIPSQAIGLPISPQTPAIMGSIHSNADLSKQAIIAQVIQQMPTEIEHKRFDATLEQALAWKRLETGTHTQDDVTWIKHECAERHHELKYDSGYSEAHERAQSRYDGFPWENKF